MGLGFFYEIFFHIRCGQVEGHIHAAAGVFLRVAFVEAFAFIDDVIDELRFDFISFFDSGKAAHVLDPAEHAVQAVDAEDRRCIESGIFFHEGPVLQVLGDVCSRFGEKIFFDDGESHAGSAEIFLDARPDEVELIEIQLTREDVGRHVADYGHIHFREFPILCAINGVVGTKV